MAIHYFEEDVKSGLTQKRKLSSFLKDLVLRHLEVKKVALNYVFCQDDYLLEKNKQFLNHNTLTDIITFDLSEREEELVSEIYISTDRVKENAEKFGVSYQMELHRVIFHGALHLCGFKDKKADDKAQMSKMENACLAAYFAAG
jgi:probable rRNA maturation factor